MKKRLETVLSQRQYYTGGGPVGTKRNVHELLLFGEFDGQMEQKRKIGE